MASKLAPCCIGWTGAANELSTDDNPRVEFALFEPLPAAPSDALWLDLAWHCADGPVDKTASVEGE